MSSGHQVIASQAGASFVLQKNQFLEVITPTGHQVSDLFCVNLHDRNETFSAARTSDYNDNIFISSGKKLYSNRSSEMLSIVKDTCVAMIY